MLLILGDSNVSGEIRLCFQRDGFFGYEEHGFGPCLIDAMSGYGLERVRSCGFHLLVAVMLDTWPSTIGSDLGYPVWQVHRSGPA